MNTAAANPKAKTEFAITAADRAHWAFQPVRRPEPPAVKNRAWTKTPIDHFILAAQEAKGLRPSAPASRETLIRRVTLDLVGLPPIAGGNRRVRQRHVARMRTRSSSIACSRRRTTASAGAGTGSTSRASPRATASNTTPSARTRGVIATTSFARSTATNLTTVSSASKSPATNLFPGDPDALTATAFNLLGPDMVDSADQIQRRRNTLNDMTDTTALTFLGLTMGCARCHDHKFEPISQRDYYSLQAFFAPAKFRNDLPVPTAAERETYEAAMREYNEQTKTLQPQIADLEAPYRQTLYDRKLAKLSPEAQAAHQAPKEQRTTEQENQIQETAELLDDHRARNSSPR